MSREIATVNMTECSFEDNHAMRNMFSPEIGGWEVFIDGGYAAQITSCKFKNCSTFQPLLVGVGSKEKGRDNPSSIVLKDSNFIFSPDPQLKPDVEVKPYQIGDACGCTVEKLTCNKESYVRAKGVKGVIDDPMSASCFKKGRDTITKIDTIVIHHTSALNWEKSDNQFNKSFRDLFYHKHPELAGLVGDARTFHPKFCKAIFEAYRVSAHYLIDREGYLNRLVDENDVAWHAGQSRMPDGRERVNDFSIGIELIATHPDDDSRVKNNAILAYTNEQYEVLIELIASIQTRHPIKFIVGHDEIAPFRKKDPGPLFDWNKVRNSERAPLTNRSPG